MVWYKRFSTEEAAKEYVIMNKPCLSISDIMNECDIDCDSINWNRLKRFVEQKLKT